MTRMVTTKGTFQILKYTVIAQIQNTKKNDDEHKEGGVDMDMTTNGPVKTVFAPDLYYRFSQPLLHLPASSLLFLTTRL